MARTELIPSPRPYVSDLWLDPFGQDAYEATEQDVRFGEETRRISMALQMMETVLTVATRVESLNTSLLDHALKRYQALQTRDLDDRSPISTAAEVTIVYPPSEIDNRLSRGN